MAKKKIASAVDDATSIPTGKKVSSKAKRITDTAKKTSAKKGPKKAKIKQAAEKKLPKFQQFPSELESAQIRLLPVSSEVEYARAQIALETEIETIKKSPEFLFADVGYKFTGGIKTNHIAVRIHVRTSIPKDDKRCIGKMCLNGTVPTDVIVSNFRNATSTTDAGSKIRSDGLPSNEFGTLGMGVTGSTVGLPLFLTCAHVVTSDPPLSANNFIKDTSGHTIAKSANRDSRFYRFDGRFDVALLAPAVSIPSQDLGRFVSNLPPGVSAPNRIGGLTSADLDRIVYKIGANLPHSSKGFIDSIHSTPIPIGGSPAAIDHFVIRSTQDGSPPAPGHGFANLGDSGSIVFTDDGRIIGMVRAVLDENHDNEGDRAVVTQMVNIAASFPIRF